MDRPQTILVVDDEPVLTDVVTYNLRQAGFETVVARSGREALRLVEDARPDLVILDLMLPELDGLTVCRALRERHPSIPVVMLTARDSELDRVLGLETGADDYVTKPFSPRELVARVRAVLRRSARAAVSDTGPAGETYGGGTSAGGRPEAERPGSRSAARVNLGRGVELDRPGREVRRGGEVVELTPTEYRLFETLAAHPGQALSRTQLLELIWGENAFGDERTVDVHVRHLREKLEEDPSRPSLIVTVRGFGYKLVPGPVEAGEP